MKRSQMKPMRKTSLCFDDRRGAAQANRASRSSAGSGDERSIVNLLRGWLCIN